ncbi:tRNA (adenosine(37)-N6)-dimethylallyltransferase MiaA [Marinobacterium sediminicola]|uniref:tRNA dimethylallyltransferase n=1 Tax=Marinobacterium sediminicola TaxID=518898 RepID=A0ABY1S454_9GAMM|nr:tRNA (adenosine(37)-N6)-dimethylallyltransferase MiaA [Marinobacterium sediminicola]ULG69882.1 tRNA (adenosine(37)-N6)-dimethylallyltransferase MiaA [Marinobacterium sediminicola]SMR77838.1 tRNA dimethylallyltransferase [Marinobacterium sediminicola]
MQSQAKNKPKVIFVMGPTASGKTDLAMRLCDHLPCELISVDSAMVYRDMDIGTAKPTSDELNAYPHRLVDILDPAEAYSAAQFREDALAQIADIQQADRIPVLVGGTMLYFNALQQGLAALPEADPELRARVEAEAAERGWPAIHARLAELDPEGARRLKPTDSQRLQRALEVVLLTGKPISEHWREQAEADLPFEIIPIALAPAERSRLHQRIEQRFDIMLKSGFEEEVRRLWERGDLHAGMPSIRCVGYRQMWSYFSGDYDRETMRYKGVVATRQLAKRQLTWLRGWEGVHWLESESSNLVSDALKLSDPAVI